MLTHFLVGITTEDKLSDSLRQLVLGDVMQLSHLPGLWLCTPQGVLMKCWGSQQMPTANPALCLSVLLQTDKPPS